MLSQPHQGGVYRNSRQPSRKAGSSVETFKMNESAYETLLNRILSIFAVSSYTQCGVKQLVRMTLDQFAEGFPIAVLGCGHELIVMRCLKHFRESSVAFL